MSDFISTLVELLCRDGTMGILGLMIATAMIMGAMLISEWKHFWRRAFTVTVLTMYQFWVLFAILPPHPGNKAAIDIAIMLFISSMTYVLGMLFGAVIVFAARNNIRSKYADLYERMEVAQKKFDETTVTRHAPSN